MSRAYSADLRERVLAAVAAGQSACPVWDRAGHCEPVGLSGGNLPRAILDLLRQRRRDERSRQICREVLGLVDWAKSFGSTSAERLPLSPADTGRSVELCTAQLPSRSLGGRGCPRREER